MNELADLENRAVRGDAEAQYQMGLRYDTILVT